MSDVADLEQQADHAEPEDRSEPDEVGAFGESLKPTETAPHLILELEGDRQLFRARGQKANQFLLVKYVDQLAVPGFSTTDAVTKLALGQVVPSERPRLERYLEAHGFADNYDQALYDALDACWKGETLLPFAPSSAS